MFQNDAVINHIRSATPAARLFPEEADALLERLCASGWNRVPEGYGDPLDMLFGHRFRQWTLGWDPEPGTADLWLLIWETDSWREKPVWNLYGNGRLVFQEEMGFSRRGERFDLLLESARLPFISHQSFLSALTAFLHPEAQRKLACQALGETLTARPEIFPSLRESLFQLLETDLGNSQWPTLDVLKLHRLSCRIPVIGLFRRLAESGLLDRAEDQDRLEAAIEGCREEFTLQEGRLSPLLEADYRASRQKILIENF